MQMMRAPTDRRDLYQFWIAQTKAIAPFRSVREAKDAGLPVLDTPDDPQCGFYRRRLLRGGPFVPCRIFLEQKIDRCGELVGDEVLRCQIAGGFFDPVDQWLYLANRPITQAEYKFGVAHRDWTDSQAPEHVADPEIEVDFLTVDPPMIKTKKRAPYGKRGTYSRRR